MEILKDGSGKPQGIIRTIAGGQKRLYDPAGRSIATYHPNVDFTYGNDAVRIGSGDRLAGMIGEDEE